MPWMSHGFLLQRPLWAGPSRQAPAHSHWSKVPASQSHTTASFHPVVLQLLVSHPMVFIRCCPLLNSLARSIAVPCLGWLCFSGAGRHCLCAQPGSLSLVPVLKLTAAATQRVLEGSRVGSPLPQFRPRPPLRSLSQDTEVQGRPPLLQESP